MVMKNKAILVVFAILLLTPQAPTWAGSNSNAFLQGFLEQTQKNMDEKNARRRAQSMSHRDAVMKIMEHCSDKYDIDSAKFNRCVERWKRELLN